MRNPKQSEKGKKTFIPLIPTKLGEYLTKFYKSIHELDFKYTTAVYETVQKYTLLRNVSKVLGVIFDLPAIPVFLLFYYKGNGPHLILFTCYLTFLIIAQEFGIKRMFNRHRPATAGVQPGYSFPSSHSFTSGIIIAVSLLFPIPLKGVLVFLALVNAINRTALGVHYLADISVGLFLGLAAGLLWFPIQGIAGAFL